MKRTTYRKGAFFLIKMSIVVGALYFIFQQVQVKSADLKTFFYQHFFEGIKPQTYLFFFIILLSFINWFLEIKKWQVLVKNYQYISFPMAIEQSLAAHTLSFITPYKTGEYVGKAAYFSKKMRKNIIGLTFFSNSLQLVATLVLGGLAFGFFSYYFKVEIPFYRLKKMAYVLALLILFFLAGYQGFAKKIGWQRFVIYFKTLHHNSGLYVSLLSFLRFVVFSHQFYFLLVFFQVPLDYPIAMMLIGSIYFISAIVPVISLFDFAIKGSIAIYVFSYVPVEALTIVTITFLMWLFNFVIPALLGSIYMLKFKKLEKTNFQQI